MKRLKTVWYGILGGRSISSSGHTDDNEHGNYIGENVHDRELYQSALDRNYVILLKIVAISALVTNIRRNCLMMYVWETYSFWRVPR